SRPLVDQIIGLRDEVRARGLDRVVLCGMGGSSLAPEVICHTAGVDLTVLDSSQPDMVRGVLADRLDATVVVVSSKSGGTVETDSQRRAFEQAFRDAGIDPAERIVVVTDPGSPLETEAQEAGYRVFAADPDVGGRYSALSAFGLVPSGLAGADIAALLDDAEAAHDAVFADSSQNPALRLGVLIGVAHRHRVDKLVLADQTGHGVGDWIEQLVAESTGKQGRGVLPVVVPFQNAVNFEPSSADSILVTIGTTEPSEAQSGWSVGIDGPLGAQMLAWEVATAVAGRLIGIDPFDQPDVESAKQAAREVLDSGSTPPQPDAVDGGIELYGTSASTVEAAVRVLLDQLDLSHGYVAIQAYLDRHALQDLASVRESVAARVGRPTTFGWGPRFLHSTGQFHKGGTPLGVFLQITCEPAQDLAVPGRDFTFGSFIASQAVGDAQVLRDAGRPVLRLHLTDLDALARVQDALR
ncbi:MAG: glucose-6-phosphate isomerase, partial [Aeromicrobium sp.]